MLHINFQTTGGRRAVLRIMSDGTASLDRTRSGMDAIVNGTWRGYWPISASMRDRILSLPAVREEAVELMFEAADDGDMRCKKCGLLLIGTAHRGRFEAVYDDFEEAWKHLEGHLYENVED